MALNSGEATDVVARIVSAMERVVRGKRDALERFVTCAIARGHVLVEDLPGLGKTTIAKTFAALLGEPDGRRASFKRVQCTPDLLPYDITGVDVFNPDHRTFEFRHGPVFANVVLADELNRTTPKVQSALLEAMAERQVTVGLSSHALPEFFFVAATQNPIESEGTYPLPAAQLDRFLMRIEVGYPDEDAEFSIVTEDPADRVLPSLEPAASVGTMIDLQNAARAVTVDDRLSRAIVHCSRSLRARPEVSLGPSPRASLALADAIRAWALLRGRAYAVGQDVVDLAACVMAHRIHVRDVGSDPARLVREEAVAAVERHRN